jgi:hypothetical protein
MLFHPSISLSSPPTGILLKRSAPTLCFASSLHHAFPSSFPPCRLCLAARLTPSGHGDTILPPPTNPYHSSLLPYLSSLSTTPLRLRHFRHLRVAGTPEVPPATPHLNSLNRLSLDLSFHFVNTVSGFTLPYLINTVSGSLSHFILTSSTQSADLLSPISSTRLAGVAALCLS